VRLFFFFFFQSWRWFATSPSTHSQLTFHTTSDHCSHPLITKSIICNARILWIVGRQQSNIYLKAEEREERERRRGGGVEPGGLE